MSFHDAGHGYDVFGFHPPTLSRVLEWVRPFYDIYFRVSARGVDHLPEAGAGIVVANHGGALPLDGALLGLNVAYETSRVLRIVADRFVPQLPAIGAFFSRLGTVSGSRGNVRCLLERGELIGIFPEGVSGVGKPRNLRYCLQEWRVGHAELAIRHRVPVIPAAIVGAEEAWPLLTKLGGVSLFGAPYIPVPATPLPLPVPVQIHYGAPLMLYQGLQPEQADEPAVTQAAAQQTRRALETLLKRGLAQRSEAE